ncbi:MAG: ester cyclase [Alphaproteobacteria bacterium]
MTKISEHCKSMIAPLRRAMVNFDGTVEASLRKVFHRDAQISFCHPFGDVIGSDALYELAYAPLLVAMPDLERRDMILLAGRTPEGKDWIGMMGNYMGTFVAPFLGIPPTGHLAHMRYHEFYQVEEGKIIQVQAIWDIPELMMQANAWPMARQMGKFLATPSPMTQDGLTASGDGTVALDHVVAMLTDLCKHPANPDPAVMKLQHYWHSRNNWYGPAGIGTSRGIDGFRHWHQIPFLRAMPDRKLDAMGDLMSHWVAEGNYVCETGWPNMRLTLTNDGWMGIAPAGKEVTLRSLDFWRVEDGKIRENWVLVDLLDLYRQIDVDVLARLNEFNKARNLSPVNIPSGLVQ